MTAWASAALAATVLALTAAQPAAAVSLAFDPTTNTVDLGEQATVDIIATGLGAGDYIGAFDISVTYDSSILGVASVDFTNALGDLGSFEALAMSTDTPPTVNANNVSLLLDLSGYQSPPADLTLFSLTFNTLSGGVSPLTFSSALLGDDFGFPYSIDTLGTGSITVEGQVIPEPSAWLLTASGLALLVWRRRRPAR